MVVEVLLLIIVGVKVGGRLFRRGVERGGRVWRREVLAFGFVGFLKLV